MTELVAGQPFDFVTLGSNLCSSWMFSFVFVLSGYCKFVTCTALMVTTNLYNCTDNQNEKEITIRKKGRR